VRPAARLTAVSVAGTRGAGAAFAARASPAAGANAGAGSASIRGATGRCPLTGVASFFATHASAKTATAKPIPRRIKRRAIPFSLRAAAAAHLRENKSAGCRSERPGR
jgi:hypothetical protein